MLDETLLDRGKKIRCHKCRRFYYTLGRQKFYCPYCAKDALVPDGTVAVLQLSIQSGGYDDKDLCLAGGLASKAKSGAIYLKAVVQVLSGPQRNKKFSTALGISGGKDDFWQNQGRELIRGILNSAQGLSPDDDSRKAIFGRILDSYRVLDGIAFVGEVGVRKNKHGRLENWIPKALAKGDCEYDQRVDDGAFVPAVKTSSFSDSDFPNWLSA